MVSSASFGRLDSQIHEGAKKGSPDIENKKWITPQQAARYLFGGIHRSYRSKLRGIKPAEIKSGCGH